MVRCPYCDLRSVVRGERGTRRYQVALEVDRAAAKVGLGQFLSGHRAITKDVVKRARLTEAFVAYLPFWTYWARVLGWVFGEERVGSGDDAKYVPREVKVAQEMSWNQAACDVGEFGVTEVKLSTQALAPFIAEQLHAQGMVFEPIGSENDAVKAAEGDFNNRVRSLASLSRVAQVYTRLVKRRMGLVYYPLWVLRYLYRGRAFQVVVDGHSGEVLYGKAPGSNVYRAAILVGGMALGAFLAIDASAIAFTIGVNLEDEGVLAFIAGGIALIVAGFGIMVAAYRKFRYGEIFEYKGSRKKGRRSVRKKEGETYHAEEVQV
jgi:hypothetical protein